MEGRASLLGSADTKQLLGNAFPTETYALEFLLVEPEMHKVTAKVMQASKTVSAKSNGGSVHRCLAGKHGPGQLHTDTHASAGGFWEPPGNINSPTRTGTAWNTKHICAAHVGPLGIPVCGPTEMEH